MSDKKRVVKTPIVMKKPERAQTNVKQTNFRDYLNVFEFKTVLPGTGEVIRFKPLTPGHLKQLVTLEIDEDEYNPKLATQVFDEIFKVSILNEDFDLLDITLPDRWFLLLEIRKKTKGESEKFQFTCPKCKSQSIQNINLNDVTIIPKKKNIDYQVELTDKISVILRFVTRRQELEAYEAFDSLDTSLMNKNSKELEISILLESQSIDQIITPEGAEKDITIWDKKYLLENIPQPLYKKVADWHSDYNYGPNMDTMVSCTHCDYKIETDLTQLDFFA